MPLRVIRAESTPNPNAMKFVVEPSTGVTIRSYFRAEQASGDSLGEALFAVPGVTNVLIQPGWIAVNKSPDAAWPAIKRRVERALAQSPTPDLGPTP
jgi:hypothetical protein